MNRKELEHALRAAGSAIDEKQFIVIGSQSILGFYADPPIELSASMEVDLIPKNNKKRTRELEAIGETSKFFETYGYYVDPVSESTATLPRHWKNRLVNVQNENTGGVLGLCLHPEDLFVAKVAANRDKDIAFVRVMIAHGMIDRDRVLLRTSTVPCPEDDLMLSRRMMGRIERIFEESAPLNATPPDLVQGYYSGIVRSIGVDWLRQDLGGGQSVRHPISNLNRIPQVDQRVTVQYKNGKGYVGAPDRSARQGR